MTRLGVRWVYRVIDEPDKHVQSLCAPAAGQRGTGGRALGVLARTRFLGTDPAEWTAALVG